MAVPTSLRSTPLAAPAWLGELGPTALARFREHASMLGGAGTASTSEELAQLVALDTVLARRLVAGDAPASMLSARRHLAERLGLDAPGAASTKAASGAARRRSVMAGILVPPSPNRFAVHLLAKYERMLEHELDPQRRADLKSAIAQLRHDVEQQGQVMRAAKTRARR
jgi:hypothetical protein